MLQAVLSAYEMIFIISHLRHGPAGNESGLFTWQVQPATGAGARPSSVRRVCLGRSELRLSARATGPRSYFREGSERWVSLVLVSDGPQGLVGYLDFAHLDFVAIEITGCDDHFEGKK